MPVTDLPVKYHQQDTDYYGAEVDRSGAPRIDGRRGRLGTLGGTHVALLTPEATTRGLSL
jgi:hypothetical protein